MASMATQKTQPLSTVIQSYNWQWLFFTTLSLHKHRGLDVCPLVTPTLAAVGHHRRLVYHSTALWGKQRLRIHKLISPGRAIGVLHVILEKPHNDQVNVNVILIYEFLKQECLRAGLLSFLMLQ